MSHLGPVTRYVYLCGLAPALVAQVLVVEVTDPSGAVVPGAEVTATASGETRRSETGAGGLARLALPQAGRYAVKACNPGFECVARNVRVPDGERRIRLALPLAGVRETLEVAAESETVNLDSGGNRDVLALDPARLDKLPVLGGRVLETLGGFLDAGTVGTEGASLIVDGLESNETDISLAGIEEIRINQNPYSAEFHRPGAGRIEIRTRSGSPKWHGDLRAELRDSSFDARNPFALTRPDESRRRFSGSLSGPLSSGAATTFRLSVEHEREDLQTLIVARTPDGHVRQNFPTPGRDSEVNAAVEHQFGVEHVLAFRFEYERESELGLGAGGFRLAETAADGYERESEFQASLRSVLSTKWVSEFSARFERERSGVISRLRGVPLLVVEDAFTSGGAQSDEDQRQSRLRLSQIFSVSSGNHFARFGIQWPTFERRRFVDGSERDGVFRFASLADYTAGRPYSFQRQAGVGAVRFWQAQAAGFIQDDYRVRRNLSIGIGLRWDYDKPVRDRNNLAPRLFVAFAPGRQSHTVIRAGSGIFYDRMSTSAIRDRLLLDGERLRRILLTNPSYPNPSSSGATALPASLAVFSPSLRSPYLLHYSLRVEHTPAPRTSLWAGYTGNRGVSLFRSRDVNAPRDGVSRPDPGFAVVRWIESAGRLHGHALETGIRARPASFLDANIQYRYSRTFDNTGGIDWFPADSWNLAPEWGRANFDRRHQLRALAVVEAATYFDVGIILMADSGSPYELTTGNDDNGDGFARDRPPGVRRNSLEGAGRFTVDVEWSREWKLNPRRDASPALRLAVDAFNVLNRVNYSRFVGNLSSPFFGLPVAASSARRLQFGLRFRF